MSKPNQIPPIYTLSDKGNMSLSPIRLRTFLESQGWGQFMTTTDRTKDRFFFRNDKNILKIYNSDNIRNWLIKYVEKCLDDENQETVFDLIDKLSRYPSSSLENQVLVSIDTYGEQETEDCEFLPITRDEIDKCYVRFKNGVVVITKDSIEKVPYGFLDNDSSAWESSIITRDIELSEPSEKVDTEGLFAQFCLNAMRMKDPKITATKDWRDEYPITDKVIQNFKSLMSAIGYLIHSNNSVEKCILFIDRNSTITKEEGQNGKTRVVEGIGYFRDRLSIDGRNGLQKGDKFKFSGVTPSTGLVQFDDIAPTFDFKSMFSFLTGDFVVEGKYANSVVIPREKKPKFVITTNYAPPENSTSHANRRQVVEFGDYWNRCVNEGELVWDENNLGRRLYDGFTDEDWNDFYNFGFQCVQLYLKRGLLDTVSGTYMEKSLASAIAKEPEVSEWIRNYVVKDRLKFNHHLNGVADYHLYEMFRNDMGTFIANNWNQSRFLKTLFEYVTKLDGYEWNPMKSGETLSAKRWLKTESTGVQKPYIKIVGVKDDEESVDEEEPDFLKTG